MKTLSSQTRAGLRERRPHLGAPWAELRRQRSGGRGDPGSGRRQISCSNHKTRLYLKLRIRSKHLVNETRGHCKDFGVMCDTTYRAATPTVVFAMQHSSQAESHGLRSAAACTAVQQPHTQRKGYECSICKTVWTFQSFCTRCPNVFSGYIFRG